MGFSRRRPAKGSNIMSRSFKLSKLVLKVVYNTFDNIKRLIDDGFSFITVQRHMNISNLQYNVHEHKKQCAF